MAVNYKNIGERIQNIRKLRNMSVNDLAAKTHFTPKSVVMAEYGQATLDLDFLVPVCVALGVTPNDLLEGEFPAAPPVSADVELALEELKSLVEQLKQESGGKLSKGTVIKDTEEALEDIRQMVDQLHREEREQKSPYRLLTKKYKV